MIFALMDSYLGGGLIDNIVSLFQWLVLTIRGVETSSDEKAYA